MAFKTQKELVVLTSDNSETFDINEMFDITPISSAKRYMNEVI